MICDLSDVPGVTTWANNIGTRGPGRSTWICFLGSRHMRRPINLIVMLLAPIALNQTDIVRDTDYDAMPSPDGMTRFAGILNEAKDDILSFQVVDNKKPVPDGAIEVFIGQRLGGHGGNDWYYAVRVQKAPNDLIEQKLVMAAILYLETKSANSFGTGAMGLAGQDDTAAIGRDWVSYTGRFSEIGTNDQPKIELRKSGQCSTKVLDNGDIVLFSTTGNVRITNLEMLSDWFDNDIKDTLAKIDVAASLEAAGIDLKGAFLRRNPNDETFVVSSGNVNAVFELQTTKEGYEVRYLYPYFGNFDGAIDLDGDPAKVVAEVISFTGSALDGTFDFELVPLEKVPEQARIAFAA